MLKFTISLIVFLAVSGAQAATSYPQKTSFNKNLGITKIMSSWGQHYGKVLKTLKDSEDKKFLMQFQSPDAFKNIKAFPIVDTLVIQDGKKIVSIKQVQASPLKLQINGKIIGPIDMNHIYKSFNPKKTALMEMVLPVAHADSDGDIREAKWGYVYAAFARYMDEERVFNGLILSDYARYIDYFWTSFGAKPVMTCALSKDPNVDPKKRFILQIQAPNGITVEFNTSPSDSATMNVEKLKSLPNVSEKLKTDAEEFFDGHRDALNAIGSCCYSKLCVEDIQLTTGTNMAPGGSDSTTAH